MHSMKPTQINPELLKLAHANLKKTAFVPMSPGGMPPGGGGMPPGGGGMPPPGGGGMPPPGGGGMPPGGGGMPPGGAPPMPMDPSMMGGAPPGGAPPMPMDPSMMMGGGAPPAPPAGPGAGGDMVQLSLDDLRQVIQELVGGEGGAAPEGEGAPNETDEKQPVRVEQLANTVDEIDQKINMLLETIMGLAGGGPPGAGGGMPPGMEGGMPPGMMPPGGMPPGAMPPLSDLMGAGAGAPPMPPGPPPAIGGAAPGAPIMPPVPGAMPPGGMTVAASSATRIGELASRLRSQKNDRHP